MVSPNTRRRPLFLAIPWKVPPQRDQARRSSGLPDLHFHDLPHLAATLTAATGAGVKEIMHRLGHSSTQAALRYQHATPERDRAIADAIALLIDAAASATDEPL